jgi:hypothetical protein
MDAPQVDNTVVINKPGKILSGSFVRTIITGASKYDLEAQLIRD